MAGDKGKSVNSGKIVLRCSPSLHQKLKERARKDYRSLNSYVVKLLTDCVNRPWRSE